MEGEGSVQKNSSKKCKIRKSVWFNQIAQRFYPSFKVLTNHRYHKLTHYPAGQYLSEIFQPLTINDYNIKDSFDAAN